MKLTDIIIPDYLAKSTPSEVKINRVKRWFIKYGEREKPIIISRIVRSDFRPMDIPRRIKWNIFNYMVEKFANQKALIFFVFCS